MTELSPQVIERLAAKRELQDSYRPNERIAATLAQKELVMVIGPVAVGKSFLINELTRQHDNFGKVKRFATRPPRPDDTPETMMAIEPSDESLTKILDCIDTGDVVNYSAHPITNSLDGTFADSYPAEINLLPAMATSVPALETTPFRDHHFVGLVATIGSWDTWFENRIFADNNDRYARLLEASVSLDWLLAQPDMTIVVNQRGQIERAVADAEEAILGDGYSSDQKESWATGMAEQLYEHIEKLSHCRCHRSL